MTTTPTPDGPDLTQGITLADFGERRLMRGFVGKKQVLLARMEDDRVVALGNLCTHYHGRLDRGRIEGEAVRCPLHHALFSLHTGEALNAPAFSPVAVWKVEREGDRFIVREKLDPQPGPEQAAGDQPGRIVIVGGGASGFAAAEMLRRRGFSGQLTMFSADPDLPIDRPNLSKDYLSGGAKEEWMPLRPADWYPKNDIDLHLSTEVASIDREAREVVTADGQRHGYDRLLLATGSEPIRLPIPGAEQPHVFTLRSLADARHIIAAADSAKTAVILGSGFIGLETAAALTKRGLSVHVVSLDTHPLERVLGLDLGEAIRARHEAAGTVFHMQNSIETIGAGTVTLKDGSELSADLVLLGIGVRPRLALAKGAGLTMDHGVSVNDRLQTSDPAIFAAGDIARWPWWDEAVRIEHWIVATRQGQVAAENMLGADKPYRDAPFFWTAHHDLRLQYVGFASSWDEATLEGDIAARDCMVSYRRDGRLRAAATVGRPQAAISQAIALTEGD